MQSSIVPRRFGGNIDCRELGAGATLYLPVMVPGALFSAGDGHAAQGDGEVCLTAVETGLEGDFRLSVVKGLELDLPRAETETHLITLAFDPDLDRATVLALRAMVALVAERAGLSPENAYRLCSLVADVRISQLVNQHKGVHVMTPRWAL
jgi:acetamidase/formamidase